MLPMGSGRNARLMGGLALGVMFVAGGLAGAALERTLFSTGDADVQTTSPSGETPCHRRETAEDRRLRPWRDLSLSAEQRASILAILDRRTAQAEAFWQDHRAEWDSTVEGTRHEIRAILTAGQVAQYDRQRAERETRDSVRREEYRRRCGESARPDGSRDGGGKP
ncbi:MAG: hypothetical protein ACREL7_08715 [Longimicrobiales bacterium]